MDECKQLAARVVDSFARYKKSCLTLTQTGSDMELALSLDGRAGCHAEILKFLLVATSMIDDAPKPVQDAIGEAADCIAKAVMLVEVSQRKSGHKFN